MAEISFAVNEQVASAKMNQLADQLITTCTSTTRPATPVQGQPIYETDTGLLRLYDAVNGSGWLDLLRSAGVSSSSPGAMQSGPPTMNLSSTGYLVRLGNVALFMFSASFSAQNLAVAGNNIVISPGGGGATTPHSRHAAGDVVGFAHYYRSGAVVPYVCTLHLSAVSTATFLLRSDASGAGYLGAVPSFAIGAGDTVSGVAVFTCTT